MLQLHYEHGLSLLSTSGDDANNKGGASIDTQKHVDDLTNGTIRVLGSTGASGGLQTLGNGANGAIGPIGPKGVRDEPTANGASERRGSAAPALGKMLWQFPFEKIRATADDGEHMLVLDFGEQQVFVYLLHYLLRKFIF